MASIRDLKKDIDFWTFAVVSDCLSFGTKTNDSDKIASLVESIVNTRNELRTKVCAGRKVEKKEQKAYYNTVVKELFVKVDEAFTNLSNIVKSAK